MEIHWPLVGRRVMAISNYYCVKNLWEMSTLVYMVIMRLPDFLDLFFYDIRWVLHFLKTSVLNVQLKFNHACNLRLFWIFILYIYTYAFLCQCQDIFVHLKTTKVKTQLALGVESIVEIGQSSHRSRVFTTTRVEGVNFTAVLSSQRVGEKRLKTVDSRVISAVLGVYLCWIE